MIHDYNGYTNKKPKKLIIEKCIFCNRLYHSKIDKTFDICPQCENIGNDFYD